MHTGVWTDVVLAVHPGAVVHGFEASPDLAAELSRRYVGDDRVVVNGHALGAEPARGTLYLDARNSALNSLVATRQAGARAKRSKSMSSAVTTTSSRAASTTSTT